MRRKPAPTDPYHVHTSLGKSEIGVNPPNPLKKGDLDLETKSIPTCIYTVALQTRTGIF
jgi:hypothetical protein